MTISLILVKILTFLFGHSSILLKLLVKNASNTADLQPPYPYSTWIEYWEGKSGIKLDANTKYNCPAGDCKNACYRKDFDGCHVQKVSDYTHKMYIIPLCSSCNQRTDYFFVDENLLVPAP